MRQSLHKSKQVVSLCQAAGLSPFFDTIWGAFGGVLKHTFTWYHPPPKILGGPEIGKPCAGPTIFEKKIGTSLFWGDLTIH